MLKKNYKTILATFTFLLSNIFITPQFIAHAALVVPKDRIWSGGIIPYVIDATVLPLGRGKINAAIQEYEDNTAIKFVERNSDNENLYPDYKRFYYDEDGTCNAVEIGFASGETLITLNSVIDSEALSDGTDYGIKTIVHELGHVVGLYHENSRLDLWDYFTIDWSKVVDPDCPDARETNYGGTPLDGYDYFSIMNSVPPACSISYLGGPGWDYADPIDPDISIYDVRMRGGLAYEDCYKLSEGDLDGIIWLYGVKTDPPAAPSGLTVLANPQNRSIYLHWVDNASNEDLFIIQRQVNEGLWVDVYTEVESQYTEFTDDNLNPGTYAYRVFARNAYGDSASTDAASVVLLAVPPRPASLEANVIAGEGRIVLSWELNTDDADNYIVQRRLDGYDWNNAYDGVNAGVNEYLDTNKGQGPLAEGVYFYRLVAVRQGVMSDPSNIVEAEILTATAPPDDEIITTGDDNSSGTGENSNEDSHSCFVGMLVYK